MDQLPLLIALLAALALASLAAPRLRVPQPVLLALTGGALAFVPGVPRTPLDPALILAYCLPPLLYADAFATSQKDFMRWLRPIMMLAIGLVAFTILTVGVVTRWLLPELPWAACFLLGAIVSPTDTVAVQAVLARLRVPRRTTAILGGESLVNDATGLVGVQLCVAVLSREEIREGAGEGAQAERAGAEARQGPPQTREAARGDRRTRRRTGGRRTARRKTRASGSFGGRATCGAPYARDVAAPRAAGRSRGETRVPHDGKGMSGCQAAT
jgi:hypothetical protein